MAYLVTNYKTKKAAKAALKVVGALSYYEPGIAPEIMNGTIYLEGPHYPAPHTWYAQAEVKNGKVVKIK